VMPAHRGLLSQSACECFVFPLALFVPLDDISISLRKLADPSSVFVP
jgi:hypothetical protein